MWRQVLLYTRPGAMFAEQVGAMLTEAGATFQLVMVAAREEQDELLQRFQAPGFPFAIVDGNLIGGFAEIVQAHAGGRLLEFVQARALDRPSGARPALPRRPSASSATMPTVRDPRAAPRGPDSAAPPLARSVGGDGTTERPAAPSSTAPRQGELPRRPSGSMPAVPRPVHPPSMDPQPGDGHAAPALDPAAHEGSEAPRLLRRPSAPLHGSGEPKK